jgi:Domain of unknown function (DUF4010)/MgtC family
MFTEFPSWPYLRTLARLALALAIGLFIGIERERRRKEAGLRTFAFVAALGAVGGLLGESYSLLALGLVGILVIFLNIETIRTNEGAEITTSAALLVTAFIGLLAGQGHTFTPTALGVATAALLAWKEPLAGFSRALTESELRSAILLAILAFVAYPILPTGSVDPWGLIEPRPVWITVLLIAALGFTNYVLLKLYGARGIELTGFLGGLVNSTFTVAELTQRARSYDGELAEVTYRGVIFATSAMLIRNGMILGLFAPAVLLDSSIPLALMLVGAAVAVGMPPKRYKNDVHSDGVESPPAGRRRAGLDSLVRAPVALFAYGGTQVRLDFSRSRSRRLARATTPWAVWILRRELDWRRGLKRERRRLGGKPRNRGNAAGARSRNRSDPRVRDERADQFAARRATCQRSSAHEQDRVGARKHRPARCRRRRRTIILNHVVWRDFTAGSMREC